MTPAAAIRRFRIVLGLFVAGLVVSGVTAFPLLTEMRMLADWLGVDEARSAVRPGDLKYWIMTVTWGLEDTYGQYPWIAYGTDWLAFGHIVIAMFFIAPIIKPTEAKSALWTGIAACFLVIPLALICGPLRGIPFYWRLIDCSFGVFGAVPLFYCLRLLKHIQSPVPQPETSVLSEAVAR